MAVDLEIVNAALTMLGDAPAQSEDDQGAGMQAALRLYDDLLGECLSSHPWRWAVKTAELSELNEDPPTKAWTYVYALPQDYLVAHGLLHDSGYRTLYAGRNVDTAQTYEIYGDRVASNNKPVVLEYIARVEPNQWSKTFRYAFQVKLAAELAIAVTEDVRKEQRLGEKAMELFKQAKVQDSQSRPSARPPMDPVSLARRT